MKKLISILVVVIPCLWGCGIMCDPVKTSDAVMPQFTTKLSIDTFQVGQPIPFYLESNIWPSLYYEDRIYNVKNANLSYSISMIAVTDSGNGGNISHLFAVTSDMASVKPRISGVDSQIFAYSIEWNVKIESSQSQPAFVVIPNNTGRFAISFQLGSTGSIKNDKANACDIQVEMIGSFSENETPNLILDQAGIAYEENVTLPGGNSYPVVRFYGFYVKP